MSTNSTNQQKYFLGVYANEAVLLREHLRYLLQESFRVNDAKFSNQQSKNDFGKKETQGRGQAAYGSKVQDEDDDMSNTSSQNNSSSGLDIPSSNHNRVLKMKVD